MKFVTNNQLTDFCLHVGQFFLFYLHYSMQLAWNKWLQIGCTLTRDEGEKSSKQIEQLSFLSFKWTLIWLNNPVEISSSNSYVISFGRLLKHCIFSLLKYLIKILMLSKKYTELYKTPRNPPVVKRTNYTIINWGSFKHSS